MFLAADVGGTKVNLALFKYDGTNVKIEHKKRYSSTQYGSLSEIVTQFLSEHKASVSTACFGVPGPVLSGSCQTVNLPWSLNEEELQLKLNIQTVKLINDLKATAYGISHLKFGAGLDVLRSGTSQANKDDATKSQSLIAPGTGLGQALMVWDGQRHLVCSSEGGHVEFGPQTEEQIQLLRWLYTRHKHVSVEHVCSGPGIYRIYRFLKESCAENEADASVEEYLEKQEQDPSSVITQAALKQSSPLCIKTVNLWMFCLGAEAGNLVLKSLSLAGVFLGGGIVPKILPLLKGTSFLSGFESKGRMSSLMQSIPIFAITDADAALYGAACFGAKLKVK